MGAMARWRRRRSEGGRYVCVLDVVKFVIEEVPFRGSQCEGSTFVLNARFGTLDTLAHTLDCLTGI